MPIHTISSLADAQRIVARYRLDPWPDTAGSSEGFAALLYVRHTSVDVKELSALMDGYVLAAREIDHSDALDIRNADDAMRGYRNYERRANSLLWLVREVKSTPVGRQAWRLIAEMATCKAPLTAMSMRPLDLQAEAAKVLGELEHMRPMFSNGNGAGYFPGINATTDSLVLIDIDLLDETLSVDARWKDNEALEYPLEVHAVLGTARIFADGIEG